jgi:hypothetical protein
MMQVDTGDDGTVVDFTGSGYSFKPVDMAVVRTELAI